MKTLGITQSVCSVCRSIIPAKVLTDGEDVYFDKFCAQHGQRRTFVRSHLEGYLSSQRCLKPASAPREFRGESTAACPEGCGFCNRHEQHLCLPIVEITSRCDLACPICLVDAGAGRDMADDEFSCILDAMIRAEGQIDILNISGGEPLLHPRLLNLLDEAVSRPEIVRVSISTNGLGLLREPDLLPELARRHVVISLQFDAFDDCVYVILRGQPLLQKKLDILSRLSEANISTSLTVTVAKGVNDNQFPAILDYFFSQEHIVSMMIQPLALAGRAAHVQTDMDRLSIPDVMRLLENTGNPFVQASDFAPLPCSHPLCFSLAYYLVLNEGGVVSLNGLVGASRLMDVLANRTVFGLDQRETEKLTDMVYELWSGPAASAPDADAVMRTLRSIIDEISESRSCSCFDPRRMFTVAERRIKSIFIHAFQDADTFDLARVRRCCNAYPQTDGRLIPVCVHNVLRRGRTTASVDS